MQDVFRILNSAHTLIELPLILERINANGFFINNLYQVGARWRCNIKNTNTNACDEFCEADSFTGALSGALYRSVETTAKTKKRVTKEDFSDILG